MAVDNMSEPSRTSSADLRQITKGAAVTSGGVLISQYLLSPLIGILNTRILGADLYGLFALASNIIGLLGILPLLGLHEGLIKFVPVYLLRKDYARVKGAYWFALRMVTFLGLAGVVLCVLLTDVLSTTVYREPRLAPILYAVAIVILINNYQFIFSSFFAAFKDVLHRTLIKYIYPNLSKLVILLATFFMGWGIYGVLGAVLTATCVQVVLGFVFSRRMFPMLRDPAVATVFGAAEKKEFLAFSLPLYLVMFVNIAVQQTDGLMIGYILDARSVGIYEVAFKLTPSLLIPIAGMAQVFQPMLAELFEKKDVRSVEFLYKRVTKISTMLTLPIFLVLVVFPEDLLAIFGNEFVEGSACLVVLSIGLMFGTLTGNTDPIITASGHPKWVFFNNASIMVLNVGLNALLISRIGIIGAAIATAVSIGLINIFQCVEVYYLHRIHPFSLGFLKPLLAAAIAGGVTYAAKMLIYSANLGNHYYFIPVLIAMMMGVYYFGVILLRLEDEEKRLMTSFRKKFLSKIGIGS